MESRRADRRPIATTAGERVLKPAGPRCPGSLIVVANSDRRSGTVLTTVAEAVLSGPHRPRELLEAPGPGAVRWASVLRVRCPGGFPGRPGRIAAAAHGGLS